MGTDVGVPAWAQDPFYSTARGATRLLGAGRQRDPAHRRPALTRRSVTVLQVIVQRCFPGRLQDHLHDRDHSRYAIPRFQQSELQNALQENGVPA